MWQHVTTCGDICQHAATRAHLKQTLETCRGFVALLRKPHLSRPRLEAGDHHRHTRDSGGGPTQEKLSLGCNPTVFPGSKTDHALGSLRALRALEK